MVSKSARLLRDSLQEKLGERVFITNNPSYLRRHTIINWGSSKDLHYHRCLGNYPEAVGDCVNKVGCLEALSTAMRPKFTSEVAMARQWINEGHLVYCRTRLCSSQGRGIIVAETIDQLVPAPLYTQRFKHSREYRVHCAYGDIIQITQKKRRNGSNADSRIRSNNDWVFARNLDKDFNSPEIKKVLTVALLGAQCLGIHFGAFDILYSVRQNKAVILECNTAPGLDKTTAELYADAIIEEYKSSEM